MPRCRRRSIGRRTFACILALGLLACGDAGQAPPLEALLGDSLADAPWPSDLFLRDGHLSVGTLPLRGIAKNLDNLTMALDELDGFPVEGSIFFPTADSEVESGPLAGLARLYDLTDNTPAVELELFYRARTNHVVALAPRGRTLREGHRYGCVVDAGALRPSQAMAQALDGRGPHAALYAALVSRLKAAGETPTRIGAATVFTVGKPSARLRRLRAALDAAPSPRAIVTDVAGVEQLDELLGAVKDGRSGLGNPDGIVHDQIGWVIRGTFDAPYYLASSTDRAGYIAWDEAGDPIVRATSQIPFTLVLPRSTTNGYQSVPTLIFQHGLNAGMHQVMAVANDYAAAGFATIGIDVLWHGNRDPAYLDLQHNFTGAEGADGFADDSPLNALMNFFAIDGDALEDVEPLDGRVIRDNFNQAVIDLAQLVRLVRQGDLGELRATNASLADLSLDSERLVYVGESFGSILGAQVVAIEPGLQAAVLAVGGVGIFGQIFPYSPYFSNAIGLLVRAGFDADLDLSNPETLPAEAQLSLSLLQAVIEPGDPITFASQMVSAAGKRKSLLLLHANSDESMPNEAGDALATLVDAQVALIPGHTRELRFAELSAAPLPITANRDGATVVVASFDPATHIMYTRFSDERKIEPESRPSKKLDVPIPVDNPIELLHALTVGFARSFREHGVPTVALPQ